MIDINGVKIEPKIELNFGKTSKGGNGGSVFIFSREVKGNGVIITDGGDRVNGGDAGPVHIISEKNNFQGKISAKGGKSNQK